MKKYLFFLLALWLPMVAWADETPTHTLTIECGTGNCLIRVSSADGKSQNGQVVKQDTIYIRTYQLEEGKLYTIRAEAGSYEANNTVYSHFSAWMRDGAFYSASPEISLVMGKSDIKLTAVTIHTFEPPLFPGANYFDAATGTLTLEVLRREMSFSNFTDAIKAAMERYNFASEDILRIVVTGDMWENVFCLDLVTSNYKNVQLLDMSQASGVKELRSLPYNHNNQTLKHVAFGASLDSIEPNAFKGTKIDTIDCYALTPPRCGPTSITNEMWNTYDQMLLRVPIESIELYRQAIGWSKFPNIQPLHNAGTVSVYLPTDAADGYYENMTVELTNLRSKFTQTLPVLNKRIIVFSGQISGSEYQASLKNAYGQAVGTTVPMELGEGESLKLTIDKLLRTKDVSVKVTIPDGTDVSDKVSILWTDEANNAIGHTSQLKAVAEGARLTCEVTLREEFARQYATPDAVQLTVNAEGENQPTIQLQPIQQMTLNGQVKDKETGETIGDATVALTQKGEHSQSVIATTNHEGRYGFQGTNEPGELSVSASGYLPKTIDFMAPEAGGTLPTIELEKFNGVIVNTWFTYTAAVAEGEEAEIIDGYEAYSDAAYQVYNKTRSAKITDFINKEGKLYFTTGVEAGDELTVTVSSHSNSFGPVSASCKISNNGLGYVTLPIVQKGALIASATSSDNGPVMGILYDANGRFVRSNTYRTDSLYFAELAQGDYTLISMTSNSLMRRVQLLSTLNDMKLADGTDYAKTAVHIEDGRIVRTNVPNVPTLDKAKLSFINMSWSFFIADKNILNIGQTNSISAMVFFAEQYAGRISNAELVVDMPEEIDMVENSALSGSTTVSYRIENGQYVFPLGDTDDKSLRFSLRPKAAGDFHITGSVRFKLDGVETVQPIGTVWTKVNGFAINAFAFVASSSLLYIRGTAPWDYRGEVIEIYDYDKLVGLSSVDMDGMWSSNIKFPSSGIDNLHAIKARIVDPKAGVTESDVSYVTYRGCDKIAPRVVMLDQRKIAITFNYFEKSTKEQSYIYKLEKFWGPNSPYTTEFTFIAHFDGMDISGTEGVNINVLASDGSTRTLEAEFDDVKQCWYAVSNYPNSSKLPVSAYAYAEGAYTPMSNEEKAARAETQKEAIEKLYQAAIKAAEKGETEVLPSDDETLNLRFTIPGKEPLDFTLKEMNYDEAVTYTLQNEPLVMKGDEGNMVYTYINGTDEAEMILIDIESHTALRTVISEAEIDNMVAMSKRKNIGPKRVKISDASRLKIWGDVANIGDGILTGLGLSDYVKAPIQIDEMFQKSKDFSSYVQSQVETVERRLEARCQLGDVGKPKFTEGQKTQYYNQLDGLIYRTNSYLGQLDDLLVHYQVSLGRKAVWDVGTAVLGGGASKAVAKGVARKVGPKAAEMLDKAIDYSKTDAGKSGAI
ncbi:MAG: carboxypeptidase regulatory-like domain-containing protein [Paludibacteraceae bacterium]|nr:carboxypeptidase regulatory-like domain-containing protein [Paludibacteraceae bacterium]